MTFHLVSGHLLRTAALAAALLPLPTLTLATPDAGSQVSITGALTSFRSALNPYVAGGDGMLNGVALVVDPNLPPVRYVGADPTAFSQSRTVALVARTTSVQFEYPSLIGLDYANPNVVSFAAAPPSVVSEGDTFKIGTLTYTNGFWYPFASVGLSITTHSATAALDGHNFSGDIIVKVSAPYDENDAEDNADYFYLQDADGPLTTLGSARVYERAYQPPTLPGNTGTVDVYARIGSLVPVRFDHPSADAFLSSSLDPVISSVPEATSQAMMAVGLLAAWLLSAWRRRA